MKFFYGNTVYIHYCDMAELARSDIPIPRSIYLLWSLGSTATIDESNRYRLMQLTDRESVDFVRDLDWILDYREMDGLSEVEIIEFGRELVKRHNEMAREFNQLNGRKQESEGKKIIDNCNLINYKARSVAAFRSYLLGEIEMELPEHITIKRWREPDEQYEEDTIVGGLKKVYYRIKNHLLLSN